MKSFPYNMYSETGEAKDGCIVKEYGWRPYATYVRFSVQNLHNLLICLPTEWEVNAEFLK